MSKRTTLFLLGVPIVLAVLLTAVGVGALGDRRGAPEAPVVVSEHPTTIPTAVRTVVVSRAMPLPSAQPRRLSAKLEVGTMPARPMMGRVLSDTDCAPDAHMISHCRNVVDLANGRQIVLRHPHDMSHIPCLAPGERVRLVPATA